MKKTANKFFTHRRMDSIGVVASVLCAIHCALTPILLILLPTFGRSWSHPATHWGMALIVIPIAIFMMRSAYKKYAKKKVLYVGSLGIVFIIVGAILPYAEVSAASSEVVPEFADQETQELNSASADAKPVKTDDPVG